MTKKLTLKNQVSKLSPKATKIKKHKKPSLILKPTPSIHICKHTTKTSIHTLVTNFVTFWNKPFDPVFGEVMNLRLFVSFWTLSWYFRHRNPISWNLNYWKLLKSCSLKSEFVTLPKKVPKLKSAKNTFVF